MASGVKDAQTKNTCGACAPKQVAAVTLCSGCLVGFCRKHFNDHRDLLSNNFQDVIQRHSDLSQTLENKIETSSNLSKNAAVVALLKEIDEWKKKTIEIVVCTADKLSESIKNLFTEELQHGDLKMRIENIKEQLETHQESESFVEPDIEQWKKQLDQLKNELARPLTINTTPPVLNIHEIDWNAIIQIYFANENQQYLQCQDANPTEQSIYELPCVYISW